jgi:hypothetical protein
VEEQIGKHSYRLKLLATLRLHLVFHVNNLRPCSTAPLRPAVSVVVHEGDDDEFDVSHIFALCIKSLHGRRGKYILFMTHFSDDDIPPVWHWLNEVHRTMALQEFLETQVRFQGHQKCEIRDPRRRLGYMPPCTYRQKKKMGVDHPVQFQRIF